METQRNALYISDLDGTLLRNDATLSPYSQQVLNQLLAEGLTFTVASARSVVSMRPILSGLRLSLPVIEFNGAFISDLATGQHHVINGIDKPVTEDLYHELLKHDLLPFISTFTGTEDCLYYSDTVNEGMDWYLKNRQKARDKRLHKIENLADALRDQVVCFTIIGLYRPLSEVSSVLQERFVDSLEFQFYGNLYSPGWGWLTIHDHKATKAQAIHRLIKKHGFDDHELVVFGDQVNDLDMFQLACRPIAVKNAIEELKRHAAHVIPSNEEDSVVKYIEQDWKNGKDASNRMI